MRIGASFMLFYSMAKYCKLIQLVSPYLYYSELTQIIADVSQDPTLPRTEDHPCPK
jgi:hypothetical protein